MTTNYTRPFVPFYDVIVTPSHNLDFICGLDFRTR